MKNVKQLLMALACTAFIAGCAGMGTSSSSANLDKKVETALKADSEVGKFPIKASAQGGDVTLTGNVNNSWQQFKAGDIAKKVDGVKSVKNNIKVAD